MGDGGGEREGVNGETRRSFVPSRCYVQVARYTFQHLDHRDDATRNGELQHNCSGSARQNTGCKFTLHTQRLATQQGVVVPEGLTYVNRCEYRVCSSGTPHPVFVQRKSVCLPSSIVKAVSCTLVPVAWLWCLSSDKKLGGR